VPSRTDGSGPGGRGICRRPRSRVLRAGRIRRPRGMGCVRPRRDRGWGGGGRDGQGRLPRGGGGGHPEGWALTTHSAAAAEPRGNKVPAKVTSPLRVSEDTVAGLTEVFRMLADSSRLMILLALAQDGELHVSALCKLLDQSQPAVSHHLTLLRMAGLVSYR